MGETRVQGGVGPLAQVVSSVEPLLSSVAYPVGFVDLEGRVLALNGSAQELATSLVGRTLVPGASAVDQLPSRFAAGVRESLARIRRGEAFVREVRVEGVEGDPRWVETTVCPVRLDGKVVGASVSAAVVDARQQRLDALARRERRYRLLVRHAPDPVAIVARDGTIRFVSAGYLRILGHERMVGRSGFELVHPDDRDTARRLIDQALENPSVPAMGTLRMRRADGSWAHLELVTSSFVDDPAVAGVVVNLRDVSERAEMEQRLRLTDRLAALGTLAAGVAHEINNPLSYVLANLERLQRAAREGGAPLGAELAEALDQAVEGAERVRGIVRDLKIFSRGTPGEAAPHRVRLTETVESTLTLAMNEIRHRARLVRDLRPAPDVWADQARLGQAVLALVVNAAQAIPEGAADRNEIRVRVGPAGTDAQLVVEDTGPGIDAAVLPHVFDPFFTTKPVGEGTGLGLSIAHRLITEMGGRLTAGSLPGGGARFEIRLPGLPPEAETEEDAPSTDGSAPPPPEATAPRPRVLIVDDEVYAARTLVHLLEDHYQAEAVHSGTAALERLRSDPDYAVVLCDLMMPDLTGMDLYEALAHEAPHYRERLVFITGGAFTSRARSFLETVGNQVLEKPYAFATVEAAVARVAAGHVA